MADFDSGSERLEQALADIEISMAGAETISRAFRDEMDEMRTSFAAASRDASRLSSSIGSSLRRSFEAVIVDGSRVSDVMRKLGVSLADKALSSALTPVTSAIGSGISGLVRGMMPLANGGVLGAGRVRAFANGGIVDGPTTFPMRGGTGLMGEAGPEAIMPLARGADGKLGVRGGGSGQIVNITMNISTPDVAGFQKSQSQVAAGMRRALSRGSRNM